MTQTHEIIVETPIEWNKIHFSPLKSIFISKGLTAGTFHVDNKYWLFNKCYITGTFNGTSHKHPARFIDCTFEKIEVTGESLDIQGGTINELTINNTGKLSIHNCTINSLELNGIKINSTSRVSEFIKDSSNRVKSVIYNNCSISDSILGKGELELGIINGGYLGDNNEFLGTNGHIIITDCIIDGFLGITGSNNGASLEFSHIKVTPNGDLSIVGPFVSIKCIFIDCLGLLRFNFTTVKSFFEFSNVKRLRIVKFIACYFNRAKINIDHFHADQVILRGAYFPTHIENYQGWIWSGHEHLMTFSGLMARFAKEGGDKRSALAWNALHHKAYRRSHPNREDSINLTISEIISNYGQSWAWPLFWFFFLGLGFYIWQINTVANQITSDPEIMDNLKGYLIENYFESLLPTRDYEFLSTEKLKIPNESITFRIIDFLSRATQAFLIYHFIRGSRKFFES